MREYVMMILALVLVVFSIPLQSFAKDEENTTKKDEVVYVIFSPDGLMKEIFVVNTFDLKEDGSYEDYGVYSEVKNMTNLAELTLKNDKVSFTTEKGKFHYQGKLQDEALPWQFTVDYFLNGEKVEPNYLAGQDGHLKIEIKTKENKAAPKDFFENYVLQIATTFDMELVDQITTEKGMIANVGEDKQVTFTVMPEEEETLTLEAEVHDFEFPGFELNAVPSFIDVEAPDVDEIEGDMHTLQKAIAGINDGAFSLRNGISNLHDGAGELHTGSEAYQAGMNELASEVKDASAELDQAFSQLDGMIAEVEDVDFAQLDSLLQELEALPSELKIMRDDLNEINDAYEAAFQNLDQAIQEIPDTKISEQEINALYAADVDEATVDTLVASYEAGQVVKQTYEEAEASLMLVSASLTGLIDILDEMILLSEDVSSSVDKVTNVGDIANEIQGLTKSYETFHQGIGDLTDGISSLAEAYGEIHRGIGSLASGAKQLEDGASQLHEGTSSLKKGTDQLPKKLTDEIDALLAKYDKSDFEPISFVSSKNKAVETVQFVMKTEAIKNDTDEDDKREEKEETSVWQKFLDLFMFWK